MSAGEHGRERPDLHLVGTGEEDASAGNKETGRIHLRLYVAGQTPKSLAAIANLRRVCKEHMDGRCSVEVIDLLVQPQLAAGDQILALPTLVRRLPKPVKKIIGDLSNTERVLVGLDLRPQEDKR